MASKLNFRARTLDATRPMAIYNVEDLSEFDLNAINRNVPAMPSGMEKEEESEKHLQDILDAQSNQTINESKALVIPTPEVFTATKISYKKGYKVQRQYIHVQPFSMDAEKPDYDLDDEDEEFIENVLKSEKKFEIDVTTFEEMIDRLEKNSGHNALSAKEAKLLLKEDDDLILAVYDYWVDKRLKLKQPLLPIVKSDKRDIGHQVPSTSMPMPGMGSGSIMVHPGTGIPGTPGIIAGGSGSVMGSAATANITNTNPYIAFRRRTEKMQTRKNRKNDEASYEKMLKLRRDLSKAIVLLEMVKRREKTKKEALTLTAEIFEKRFQASDYDGKIIAEIQALKPRVLQPTHNQFFANRYAESWLANHSGQLQRSLYSRHDKKSNKKRKKSGNLHAAGGHHSMYHSSNYNSSSTPFQSDDDALTGLSANSDYEDDPLDAPFAFRRKANCQYLAPTVVQDPFALPEEDNNLPDFNVISKEPRHRYSYASISNPKPRFLGRVRRRVGRGGRYLLDRKHPFSSDVPLSEADCLREKVPHFRPVTPPNVKEDTPDLISLSDLVISSLPSKPVRVSLNNSFMERQRSVSGAVKTVPVVDSVGAQNAASALVTTELMDIFGK